MSSQHDQRPLPEREGATALLRALGADDATLPELLAYLEHPALGKEPAALAGEEPHVAVWRQYAEDAARDGVVPALARRFAQFSFPIAAGISGRDDYRAATRRGEFPAGAVDGGLRLRAPERLRLEIEDSIGGPIPVIVAPEREDFVALVQALTARNEPEPVPASMGACIVSGLNNWDRVARHRAAWQAAAPGADRPDADWQEEFRRLTAAKALYQDRLLLLSTGPYSAVGAAELGLEEADWLARSLVLRREHECTHLYTQRAFAAMRNHALDELLADCAGLVAAFGEYRPRLARRFLGIEPGDGYRLGGRLQNYRGSPPLSAAGFAVLVRLVDAAVDALDGECRRLGATARRPEGMRELVATHYRRPLTELAALGRPAAGAPRRHALDWSTNSLTEGALDRLMAQLAEFAAREQVPAPVQLDLRLVLDELLSNIHKYGRHDGRPPAVIVAARVEDGEARLEIADHGPAFDPLAAPPPRTDLAIEERPIGGLGLHLVRQLTDAASYRRQAGWNVVSVRRRLPRDTPAIG